MTQEQVQKSSRKQAREEVAAEKAKKQVDAEKLKADLDAIIDEIDEALSVEEAEATVKSYVQAGGE